MGKYTNTQNAQTTIKKQKILGSFQKKIMKEETLTAQNHEKIFL